jgi:uncharacterized damage-inducible protein DinB
MAAVLSPAPLRAQTTQTALSKEAGTLSDKFAGLARVMAGTKTIERLSDADLKAPVKLFGRDMTKEDAVRFLFADQHEHLGQSIAYARSNGVVPPWSK